MSCRSALSALLVAAALAKLPPFFHGLVGFPAAGMAIAELVAAAAVVSGRHLKPALVFVAMLAAGGASQAFFTKADCNCFGSWARLSWKAHVIITCLMGVLVAIGWPSEPRQKLSYNQPERPWSHS